MALQINYSFTAVPNIILDSCSRLLSPAEFMILMLIIRKTIGWQKSTDYISLTQYEKYTDLSRTTCIKSIKELKKIGFIEEVGVTKIGKAYRLASIEKLEKILEGKHLESESNEKPKLICDGFKNKLISNLYHPSSLYMPLPVQNLYTQKDTLIDNKNNIEDLSINSLNIPQNVDKEKLAQFVQMRKSKNNPISESGAQNLLERLTSYGGDANEALSNAIIGNHDNVIPVKKISNVSQSKKTSTQKKSPPRVFD